MALVTLLASVPTATAAVTIGQLDPGTPSVSCVGGTFDHLQPTVTTGTAYVVPAVPPASALVISSWSHNATSGAGQMLTMKVFRQVAGPTYQVVGHDGPHLLTPGTINTFAANVPVQPGDVLGMHTPSSPGTACNFFVSGETHLVRANSDLADGESGDFSTGANRLNITAVVSPSNSFTLGATTRNKKKGTATLNFTVPNPGDLTGSGDGVSAASAGQAVISKSVGAGPAQLLIKATGKKKRKLNRKGKVKLTVGVTYTPTGGTASSRSIKVKLKKKL